MKKLLALVLLFASFCAFAAADLFVAPILIDPYMFSPTFTGGTISSTTTGGAGLSVASAVAATTVPASGITGVTGIINGGTNASSFTAPASGVNPIPYYNGTSLVTDNVPSKLGYNAASGILDVNTISVGSSQSMALVLGYSGAAGYGYIHSGNIVASGTNYLLLSNGAMTQLNSSSQIYLGINNATTVLITAAGTALTGIVQLGGRTISSGTSPTIASGFGTSPSITSGANTTAFQINVGTGGTATGGVITMTAATTGWLCAVTYNGSSAGMLTYAVVTNTTTVTLTNETSATGITVAWPASQVLNLNCSGF